MAAEVQDNQKMAERLSKAIQEMKELERAFKRGSGAVDPRLLTDFRDATDHIRVTAWGMQMALAQPGSAGAPSPFAGLLTQERIRRATQLCGDLAGEIEKLSPAQRAEGREKLGQLRQVVERLTRSLESAA